MPDAVAYPLLALAAAGLVALALIWPQGQGAHSPPPFGHPPAPIAAPAPTAAAPPAAVKLRAAEAAGAGRAAH